MRARAGTLAWIIAILDLNVTSNQFLPSTHCVPLCRCLRRRRDRRLACCAFGLPLGDSYSGSCFGQPIADVLFLCTCRFSAFIFVFVIHLISLHVFATRAFFQVCRSSIRILHQSIEFVIGQKSFLGFWVFTNCATRAWHYANSRLSFRYAYVIVTWHNFSKMFSTNKKRCFATLDGMWPSCVQRRSG